MSVARMYRHFGLSGNEELFYSEQILPEGFKVCVTLPDRITNEQLVEYFYRNVPLNMLCGMNKNVGEIVVPIETINGQCMDICFNREYGMGIKLDKDYNFVNDTNELKKINVFYHSGTDAFGLEGDVDHITLEVFENIYVDLKDRGLVGC